MGRGGASVSPSQSNLLDLQVIVLGPDVIHIGDRVGLVLDEHCRFVDQLHAIDVQSFAQLIVRISALGLLCQYLCQLGPAESYTKACRVLQRTTRTHPAWRMT